MSGARLVNGYVVEGVPGGPWWVRRPDRLKQGWRFATKAAALRFARRLAPPAPRAAPHLSRRGGDVTRSWDGR